MFLISLVHHHHTYELLSSDSDPGPAVDISYRVFHCCSISFPFPNPSILLFHRHQLPFLHVPHPLFRLISGNLTTRSSIVTGGGSVGEFRQLNPARLAFRLTVIIIVILTVLLLNYIWLFLLQSSFSFSAENLQGKVCPTLILKHTGSLAPTTR